MFSESLNQSSTIHPPSQRTSLLPALPAFIGGGGLKIETARCWKFKRFMVCASFVYATLGVKTLEEIPGASSVVEWRLLCGCGTTGKNPSHSGSLFGCLFSAIFRIHHKLKGERCQKKRRFFGESCLKPSGSYQPTTFALMPLRAAPWEVAGTFKDPPWWKLVPPKPKELFFGERGTTQYVYVMHSIAIFICPSGVFSNLNDQSFIPKEMVIAILLPPPPKKKHKHFPMCLHP